MVNKKYRVGYKSGKEASALCMLVRSYNLPFQSEGLYSCIRNGR